MRTNGFKFAVFIFNKINYSDYNLFVFTEKREENSRLLYNKPGNRRFPFFGDVTVLVSGLSE